MSLVSVIIPTYNRFEILLKTIQSVKNQTYRNIEIVVVNDGSSEEGYYKHKWGDIKIIHLNGDECSRNKFGYVCAAYVRDMGVKASKGEYIAFLDDDDYFLPKKIEMQVKVMKDFDMCCTEALLGRGTYHDKIESKKMLQEYHFKFIKEKYEKNGVDIGGGYPQKWDLKFIKIHNCIITSSVMIKRSLVDKYGMMPYRRNGNKEDYTYWKILMEHVKCFFIREPLVYYDAGHGKGRDY